VSPRKTLKSFSKCARLGLIHDCPKKFEDSLQFALVHIDVCRLNGGAASLARTRLWLHFPANREITANVPFSGSFSGRLCDANAQIYCILWGFGRVYDWNGTGNYFSRSGTWNSLIGPQKQIGLPCVCIASQRQSETLCAAVPYGGSAWDGETPENRREQVY
jgi:hypothetical protein